MPPTAPLRPGRPGWRMGAATTTIGALVLSARVRALLIVLAMRFDSRRVLLTRGGSRLHAIPGEVR